MKKIIFIAIIAFALLSTANTTLANLNDRFEMHFLHPDAIAACGQVPNWDTTQVVPYHPRYKSAAQPYTKIEQISASEQLVCMQTNLPQYRGNVYKGKKGFGWVVAPSGSEFGYYAGYAYYLGTPDRRYLRCHNLTLAILIPKDDDEDWTPPPTPTPTPATPTPTPPPATPTPTPTPDHPCTPRPREEWVKKGKIKRNGIKYTVYDDGCNDRYVQKNRGGWNKVLGYACSLGGAYGIDGAITGEWGLNKRKLIELGLAAFTTFLIDKKTDNPFYMCGGALWGFIGLVVDRDGKASCPADATPVYDDYGNLIDCGRKIPRGDRENSPNPTGNGRGGIGNNGSTGSRRTRFDDNSSSSSSSSGSQARRSTSSSQQQCWKKETINGTTYTVPCN